MAGLRLAQVDDGCRTGPGAYWVSDGLAITYLPVTVVLVAHRSGGLSGRLVDPLGLPIAGACVWSVGVVDGQIVAAFDAGRTEIDGSWHIDRLIAADYVVRAIPDCNDLRSSYAPADDSWASSHPVALGAVTTVPTLVATTETTCAAETGECHTHPVL
jgi:hypothetical protein